MLVLLKQIERIVDFVEQGKVETSEINAQLKLINCDDLIQQAKDIDKEDYSEDCFGISFNYVYDDDRLYILNVPDHIYYIDVGHVRRMLQIGRCADMDC